MVGSSSGEGEKAAPKSDMADVVTVTNEKSSSSNSSSSCSSRRKYIPDDLAFYILSKLPIKSLKRFECVSKSWSILFQNSHFITMYRNHFISHYSPSDNHDSHTFLFIQNPILPFPFDDYRYHVELHLLSDNQMFEYPVKLNFPSVFHDNDAHLTFLGSTCVNGIFCIEKQRLLENQYVYVLWNPATDEFVTIPSSPHESAPLPYGLVAIHPFNGFGYDQVGDDFKVLHCVNFYIYEDFMGYVPANNPSFKPFFEIYSLKSNSWRILDIEWPPETCVDRENQVYIDGVCHWLNSWSFSEKEWLVSFDLSREVFFTTPIHENSDFAFKTRHLVVLNGSIALVSYYFNDRTISDCYKDNNFHISILGELGVSESWIKLFTIGPIPFIDWPPIGVGKKGHIFFRKEDDELVWVDLSTQIIVEIGVKAKKCCSMIGTYKESLLPIGAPK